MAAASAVAIVDFVRLITFYLPLSFGTDGFSYLWPAGTGPHDPE
jgi:hypothetical protein